MEKILRNVTGSFGMLQADPTNNHIFSTPLTSMDFTSVTSINDSYFTTCQQDKAGAGLFEVVASSTGALIWLANLIVIGVILCGGRKLHKATFYCICNLAVADMLAGLLLMWIFGLQRVALPFRTAKSELVQKSVWTVTVWSSMLSQLVIAVDRYCYVTQGYGEGNGQGGGDRLRKRWIKVGIAVTWLMPVFTFVIPVVTNWSCVDTCFCYLENNSTYYMVCNPMDYCSQTNPPFTKGSMLYLGMSLLLMPAMPCILYAKIFHFVHKSTKKFKETYQRPSTSNRNLSSADQDSHVMQNGFSQDSNVCSSCNNGFTANISPTSSSDDRGNQVTTSSCQQLTPVKSKEASRQRKIVCSRARRKPQSSSENGKQPSNKKKSRSKSVLLSNSVSKFLTVNFKKSKKRRDMRLLRTLMIILGLFVVSTVPLGVLFMISFGETDKRYVSPAKVLLTASLINSLVNPWIYFWRFPEMRKAFRKIFCSFRQRYRSNSVNNRRESAPTRRRGDDRGTYTGASIGNSSNSAL